MPFSKKLTYTLLLTAIIICYQSKITAQTAKYRYQNHWVERYTTKDGLPDGVIHGILESRSGLLWILTVYDLVRYDGYEFKTFSPPAYTYFAEGNQMLEDRDGYLWFLSHNTNNNLWRFDPNTEQFKGFELEYHFGEMRNGGILQDKSGHIWLVNAQYLLEITPKEGDQYEFKYHTYLSKTLKAKMDTLIKKMPALESILKVGNNQNLSKPFVIKEDKTVLLYGVGELYPDEPADFGWIEDATGKKIGLMSEENAYDAKNRFGNNFCFELIELPKGNYTPLAQQLKKRKLAG